MSNRPTLAEYAEGFLNGPNGYRGFVAIGPDGRKGWPPGVPYDEKQIVHHELTTVTDERKDGLWRTVIDQHGVQHATVRLG